MRKIIKNKCIDIIDIENNNIYEDCTFYDETIQNKLILKNNIIVNCTFRKIYKEIFCNNIYFNNITFEKSWISFSGVFYLKNFETIYSFINLNEFEVN